MKTYLTLLSIITAVALVSAADDESKPAPKKSRKKHPITAGNTNTNMVPGTTNYVPGTGTTNWNRPMTPPQPVQPAKPYVPTPPQPVQPPR